MGDWFFWLVGLDFVSLGECGFVRVFFVWLGWGFFATLYFGTHGTELLLHLPKGQITVVSRI